MGGVPDRPVGERPRPGPLQALSKARCRSVDLAPSGRDENSSWIDQTIIGRGAGPGVDNAARPRFYGLRKPYRWVSTYLALRSEFAAQPLRKVVEKQTDLGRKVPAFGMYNMNWRGRWFVVGEDGLQSARRRMRFCLIRQNAD
jgi:hypothetical protein